MAQSYDLREVIDIVRKEVELTLRFPTPGVLDGLKEEFGKDLADAIPKDALEAAIEETVAKALPEAVVKQITARVSQAVRQGVIEGMGEMALEFAKFRRAFECGLDPQDWWKRGAETEADDDDEDENP